MHNKLYIVRTHAINLTNLILALVLNIKKSKLYYPCKYQLIEGRFFNVTLGKFVQDAIDLNPAVAFRNINWQNNTLYLDQCVAERSVAFGTHRDDQIAWLKNHYGETALTIGISYTEVDYPMLLKNLVEYHIHLLYTGVLEPSPHDQKQLSNLNSSQLVEYYENQFDLISLIPKTSQNHCDVNIPVSDFLCLEKLQEHFNKIDLAINKSSLDLYQDWKKQFI